MSDISPVTRPELTGVPRPRYTGRPYTNVVPLTFRDATTLTEQTELIKEWLTEKLIPHIDTETSELAEAWDAAADKIVAAFVESGVELQDAVMVGIGNDPNSGFNAWLSNRLAATIQEKPDDPGVYVIAKPIITPPSGELIPDPNNPGFWINA